MKNKAEKEEEHLINVTKAVRECLETTFTNSFLMVKIFNIERFQKEFGYKIVKVRK